MWPRFFRELLCLHRVKMCWILLLVPFFLFWLKTMHQCLQLGVSPACPHCGSSQACGNTTTPINPVHGSSGCYRARENLFWKIKYAPDAGNTIARAEYWQYKWHDLKRLLPNIDYRRIWMDSGVTRSDMGTFGPCKTEIKKWQRQQDVTKKASLISTKGKQ